MATVPQSPWFCSLKPFKPLSAPSPNHIPRNCTFKILLSSSSDNSSESTQTDPVKLAFEKAKAYKKSIQSNTQNPVSELPNSTNNNSSSESTQTDPVKLAFEKARAYKKSRESNTENPVPESPNNNSSSESTQIDPVKLAFEKARAYKKSRESNTQNPVPESPNNNSSTESTQIDPVKLAFEKARAYKKSRESNSENPVSESAEIVEKNDGSSSKDVEVPMAVKLAMERAREYKQKKEFGGSIKAVEGGLNPEERENQANAPVQNRSTKKDDLKPSSMDFIGLDFSDKKEGRALPAGLVPMASPYAEGDLPEVEIIVGDASKFGNTAALKPETNVEDNSDIYEPKVSTWGVFPRPRNISKTYGGGRVINPGDVLETAEEKAAKDARARQLISAYKKQIGFYIDPKLKSECEKALNDGDALMDRGKLKEALPFYEKVMDKLPFTTELHGFAALQWAICQDSLFRSNEARVMYEKLQSHPKVPVSKKARLFMFSFQAIEMMKVKSLSSSKTSTGYQNYFEAFVKDNKSSYPLKKMEETQVDEGGAMSQVLPYIIFLFSPIFVVLFIAVKKGL